MTVRRLLDTRAAHPLSGRISDLRTALLQQKRFRLDQLQELDEAAANSTWTVDDVHDRVSDILRMSAVAALADVEDALDRLRAGTYGVCEGCGTDISYERLEVLPMSRYCVPCQHSRESRPS